jgi:hypothetical protein
MQEDINRILELRLQGNCCSQVFLQMGLFIKGKENPDLVQAVSGLCNGLYSGLVCGALTGGACLLALFDRQAGSLMIPDLVNWFKDRYGEMYGGIDCIDIIESTSVKGSKQCSDICADIIVETYTKTKEILLENGYNVELAG